MNKKIIMKPLLYGTIYLCTLFLLTCFFYFFFEPTGDELILTQIDHSWQTVGKIIKNNTLNYFIYLILFVIYPINIMLDMVYTTWSIAVSLHAQGIENTIRHLVFHGIIEIPNMIAYTYLSFCAFASLVKQKNFGLVEYLKHIKRKKLSYIICFALILIAGVIEGLVS